MNTNDRINNIKAMVVLAIVITVGLATWGFVILIGGESSAAVSYGLMAGMIVYAMLCVVWQIYC